MKITKQYTNRESQSLDRYLQEIGKVDLINAQQEIELATRIKKGDQQALEQLTKANLRFVVSVAKQYQNKGLSLGDLINEGNIGLIKAAQKFDETRGFKFISYAVWWIKQSIMQAIADQSRMVRLPLNRVGALTKISKAAGNLEQELERNASVEEIANELEMDIDDVAFALQHAGRHISVDAPISPGDDGKNSLLDIMPNEQQSSPDTVLMDDSLRKEIQNSIASLSEKEQTVIKLYFGLESGRSLTLEEIGEILNLTRERVRQIKEKALRRLRHASRSNNLKAYLG
ncbi:MAG: RNA polymerase sigma factor RpoD/SigA [Melioribacteraceae bacterium]|nr:RNA polymerase sigma factor RpoD/SigA [Melioribacteraceae bacterium]MCF8266388.1 RNA polymerase sigma factor RpoD/SigA [Melioribacteraceae bacterium]MCF8412905.1 RNA polymerase sigma factor RpoD/SigA [Melioribacteraceae bacterium]